MATPPTAAALTESTGTREPFGLGARGCGGTGGRQAGPSGSLHSGTRRLPLFGAMKLWQQGTSWKLVRELRCRHLGDREGSLTQGRRQGQLLEGRPDGGQESSGQKGLRRWYHAGRGRSPEEGAAREAERA